jgi:hypothetical protein
MYKVMLSPSPFIHRLDEYGPYKYRWHAWLVAFCLTWGADNCSEATILESKS